MQPHTWLFGLPRKRSLLLYSELSDIWAVNDPAIARKKAAARENRYVDSPSGTVSAAILPRGFIPFQQEHQGPRQNRIQLHIKAALFLVCFFFSGWTTEWHNFNFYRNASSKETKLPCMSWGMSLPSPGYFPLLEAEVMEESWGDFSVSLLKTFCQLQEYFSRASLHPFLSLAEFRLMRSVSFLFKGENPCLLST